jgi:hypothetical protein
MPKRAVEDRAWAIENAQALSSRQRVAAEGKVVAGLRVVQGRAASGIVLSDLPRTAMEVSFEFDFDCTDAGR